MSEPERVTARALRVVDGESYADWESVYTANAVGVYRLAYRPVGSPPPPPGPPAGGFLRAPRRPPRPAAPCAPPGGRAGRGHGAVSGPERRLARFVEDVLRDRRPRRFHASPEELRAMRAAAALRAARPGADLPDPAFLDRLGSRLR